MDEKKTLIFMVDDDALYLKSLEIDFEQEINTELRTFATGELCLKNLSQNPDIIILDYYLNGVEEDAIDGLEILKKIKLSNPDIPVIMLSSQDKIEVAVNCMKYKALDYIVKSETAYIRLQKAMREIFHVRKIERTLNWYMEKM